MGNIKVKGKMQRVVGINPFSFCFKVICFLFHPIFWRIKTSQKACKIECNLLILPHEMN